MIEHYQICNVIESLSLNDQYSQYFSMVYYRISLVTFIVIYMLTSCALSYLHVLLLTRQNIVIIKIFFLIYQNKMIVLNMIRLNIFVCVDNRNRIIVLTINARLT